MTPEWGWRHAWSVLGMMLLAGWSPFYFAIGLVAPGWMMLVAVAVWGLLVGLGIWWFRRHPLRTLAVGIGAIALWFVAVYVFDSAFGWTA